ncbi:MAG: VWA domain-containing protein [Acidobacteria bacterium]|nr:VWA domain-containing protein [Acidobacteriota bacterium]
MRRLVAAAAVLGCFGTGAAEAQVFRTGVETVRLGVAVVDKAGQPIAALTPDDFVVLEDGRSQQVRLFAPGGASDEERPPLHIGLLFDTSGSMVADLPMARTAAVKFCNLLQRAEDITLVDFDTEVRVARFGQQDFPRFVERLRHRKPDGWTALYDALGVYLDGTISQDGEKILVVYSDGGDTRSTMSYTDALTALKASDVTVYVVGFLDNQGSREKLEQRMRLTRLAESTGGLAFFPGSRQDIDHAYAEVLADVNARYLIGYVSTNQATDGTWRKVDVRLNRPDLKAVRVRARQGYFGLLRQEQGAQRPDPGGGAARKRGS